MAKAFRYQSSASSSCPWSWAVMPSWWPEEDGLFPG
jgi:hypothetical protein